MTDLMTFARLISDFANAGEAQALLALGIVCGALQERHGLTEEQVIAVIREGNVKHRRGQDS